MADEEADAVIDAEQVADDGKTEEQHLNRNQEADRRSRRGQPVALHFWT